jgi:hypothetical protein
MSTPQQQVPKLPIVFIVILTISAIVAPIVIVNNYQKTIKQFFETTNPPTPDKPIDETIEKDDDVSSQNQSSYSSNSSIPGKFPIASKRLLTDSDLRYLSKEDLGIMRNEIFARHGRIFTTTKWKNYFQNQSWYNPQYRDVNSKLSSIEHKNIALIQRYE